MKKAFLFLAAILWPAMATAQPAPNGPAETRFDWKIKGGHEQLTIFDKGGRGLVTFQALPGACLIGPLQLNGFDGKQVFRLARGATFPPDCNK